MAGSAVVSLPPLNSDRDAAYDMVVLEVKSVHSYTIPSFYSITLKLRHIRVRCEDQLGVHYYDVFFHEFSGCSSLQVTHPAVVCVTNGCIVKLNEFKRGLHDELNYEDLKLLSNSDVFVAYAWHWKQGDDSSGEESSLPDSESVHSSISPSPPLSEDELDFNTGFTTHTITFKCMGTTRDQNHQEVLRAAAAALKEGKDVPTRLQPEPDNPVDANAIMFECQVDKGWTRFLRWN